MVLACDNVKGVEIDFMKTARSPLGHELVDERSRELHMLIASKLRREPALLGQVREQLKEWIVAAKRSPRRRLALQEWKDLLDQQPLSRVLLLLESEDEKACRMRQSSPFTALLTERERARIFQKYDARRS